MGLIRSRSVAGTCDGVCGRHDGVTPMRIVMVIDNLVGLGVRSDADAESLGFAVAIIIATSRRPGGLQGGGEQNRAAS